MKRRVAFGGILVAVAGLLGWAALVTLPLGAALLWPVGSFLVVGYAFATRSPRVFGKRDDGSVAWRSRVALAPYLFAMTGIWHLVRRLDTVADRVADRLLLGQRPRSAEPLADASLVVDLTCEFTALPGVLVGTGGAPLGECQPDRVRSVLARATVPGHGLHLPQARHDHRAGLR